MTGHRDLDKLIESALTRLAVRAPLLAGVGRGCGWGAWDDPTSPLGATDGATIYLNLALRERTDEQILFVVAHEILHVMHRHPERSGWLRLDDGSIKAEGRDAQTWNIAVDETVNRYLVACGIVSEATVAEMNAIYQQRWDLGTSPEEIYYILESEARQQQQAQGQQQGQQQGQDGGQAQDGQQEGAQAQGGASDDEQGQEPDDGGAEAEGQPGNADGQSSNTSTTGSGDEASQSSSASGSSDGSDDADGDDDGEGSGPQADADRMADLARKLGGQAGRSGPVLPPTQEIVEQQRERMAEMQGIEQVMASGAGAQSLGLDRAIVEREFSEVNWRTVLIRYCDAHAGRRDYSYRRADSRRSLGRRDVVLPGMVGGDPSRILIALDSSGSITQEQLGGMVADVRACLAQVPGTEVDVMTWDTQAYGPWLMHSLPDVLPGGGGTRPEVVWPAAQDGNYRCVVMMTDGDFCAMPSDPGVDVLWMLYAPNAGFAPTFGEVVPMFDQWR